MQFRDAPEKAFSVKVYRLFILTARFPVEYKKKHPKCNAFRVLEVLFALPVRTGRAAAYSCIPAMTLAQRGHSSG